jgi:uncharacterized protein YcgL (UPF0745 family)
MHTWIYKGSRKANTYLYITEKDNFEQVPDALLDLLGELEFILHVELTPERKLAKANATDLRLQLDSSGFFLQLPPGDEIKDTLC